MRIEYRRLEKEEICREFVRELNRQGLTESREAFLEVQKEELMKRCMHVV